jgi:hypothetical protein
VVVPVNDESRPESRPLAAAAKQANTQIVPDGSNPAERLIELAGEWAKGVLADVTVLSEKAAARAREIPDRPELVRQVEAMWTVIGELLMRVAVLEYDLQERDAERRRQRQKRTGAA